MNKYIKHISVTVRACLCMTLVTLISCEQIFEDALDKAADSRETLEGVLSDADKVEGLLTTCYAGLSKHRCDIYFWTTFESLTDNAFDDQEQSLGLWKNGVLSPSQSCLYANLSINSSVIGYGENGSYWARYWAAIRACNFLINNMENVTVPESELLQETKDLMVDEAKILRAYYHFLLIGMYGPVPFMDEAYGVDYDGWSTLTRPTYDEIATTIANELQAVIDRAIVPLRRNALVSTDKYRVPLLFAYGLKSRVLLYNASPLNNSTGDVTKYEQAYIAAEQLLNLDSDEHLEPFEDSKERLYNSPITVNVEAVEIIWRGSNAFNNLSHIGGMNLSTTVPQCCSSANFKAGETPTQEIVDCYELKTGELIIDNYDATHAHPTFTAEAIAAGYSDTDSPYENRDDRFYRDILYNGSYFGESYDKGSINVYTYPNCPGTGNNYMAEKLDRKQTFTGYYYGKDRDPKYYGSTAGNSRVSQYSVRMRYAEIWLNYAEALCGAGKLDEACDALDKTRLRANQPSIKAVVDFNLSKEWLMHRIYNERRVELVLEDHRFFDVRRWDLISNQNNNAVSGMLVQPVEGQDGVYTHTRYQLPYTWACHNEKYKVLPIPLADQKKMPLMLQPGAWR